MKTLIPHPSALIPAALALALAGCATTAGKDLPDCMKAQAHLVQTPQGNYAAFDMEQLEIFRMATAAEARGECRFPE